MLLPLSFHPVIFIKTFGNTFVHQSSPTPSPSVNTSGSTAAVWVHLGLVAATHIDITPPLESSGPCEDQFPMSPSKLLFYLSLFLGVNTSGFTIGSLGPPHTDLVAAPPIDITPPLESSGPCDDQIPMGIPNVTFKTTFFTCHRHLFQK